MFKDLSSFFLEKNHSTSPQNKKLREITKLSKKNHATSQKNLKFCLIEKSGNPSTHKKNTQTEKILKNQILIKKEKKEKKVTKLRNSNCDKNQKLKML